MIHDPHVQPIFRVPRRVEFKKSGKQTTEHAYGMTSVAVDRASPQQVLAWNRGHWVVESHHHIRDATFREDDSKLRARNAPANHAILNTLALAVILPNPRKLPQSFHRFADARHPYAEKRTQVLHAVTRPGGPRAHSDRNRKYRAWPPNPAGLSLAPDPPKRTPRAPIRAAPGPQTSAHLKSQT